MKVFPLDDVGSFAWLARPDEWLLRASTALVAGGATYLIDPVDHPDLDAALAALPPVRAVVALLDRHRRDGASVAARHGVAVRPGHAGDPAIDGARWIRVPALPGWSEAALHLADRGLLVVPEAVGTAPYYCHPRERLGVHPLLRLRPPRGALAGIEPRVIACGHGEPVLADAAAQLEEALRTARRRLPRVWLGAVSAGRRRGR